jgi:CBS-domain-containing membrane protein
MGAPVYDSASQSFVGMFDVRDILSCVTAAHREYIELGGNKAAAAAVVAKHSEDIHQANDLDSYRKIQGELLAKAIQCLKISTKPSTPGAVTVLYLAARNPVATSQTYSKDTLLLDICKGLTSRHMHRVPITDSSSGTPGKFAHLSILHTLLSTYTSHTLLLQLVCIGIISQSGLVAFLVSKCPHGSMDETMFDAGLPFRKDVIKVAESETAFTTFELLDSKRLSGIAVVDEDGKLIGNTSAVDIKNAVMDAGRTVMDMDILSYLACVRQSQVMKNCKYPNCHVRENALG